jgi:integrase
VSTAHYRQSRYEQACDPIPFIRVWVRMLCAAGLRIDEACRLRRGDVDLTAKRLRVGRAKTDAGVRNVQLSPDTLADLQRYLQLTADRIASGPLLPSRSGTRYDRTSAAKHIIRPLVGQTNVVLAEQGKSALRDGVTAHALRKTYFTFLHEAGAPPRWVADQGGHVDPSTSLRIYTESLRDRERGQHGQAFDDLLRGTRDHGADDV